MSARWGKPCLLHVLGTGWTLCRMIPERTVVVVVVDWHPISGIEGMDGSSRVFIVVTHAGSTSDKEAGNWKRGYR